MKVLLKDSIEFRKVLIEKGYSQRKFAREIDTSEAYLNQIINMKKHASPGVARKISNGLEIEFKDLFIIK
ncbi:helix-turn-helix transcriptional regulator [Cerasibacillus terrae]|uniref:Helix-turn-helix transcriptional regulator n=1 Tax=Cerasibacillus terrae TaxID=2498845 RepID=A0A5C8P2S8_9BACI|nr:helix-turn-helix transcriptional regulator [Cerasibacillus terrae]TXL67463.1 helix-turn-helix transcriptional regulator [Cerasibacillus terrae]